MMLNFRSALTTFLVTASLLAPSSAEANGEAGTVAVVSGKAIVRHGEITVPDQTKSGTLKPEARFHDSYEKELAPNDAVMPGDIVVTSDDTYLKIYFKDDSIMDIGPNTTFKVEQFQQAGRIRNISFRMLFGKVRTLVTRALEGSSSYRVATPVSVMGVRGTEFVVHSYMDNVTYKTDITCLEGKVIVDIAKIGPGGKIITQPVTVTPGKGFSGSGLIGTPVKFNVSKLSAPQLEKVSAMVPVVELRKGGVAHAPSAGMLPGTGVTDNQPGRPQPSRGLASAQPGAQIAVMPGQPGQPGRGGPQKDGNFDPNLSKPLPPPTAPKFQGPMANRDTARDAVAVNQRVAPSRRFQPGFQPKPPGFFDMNLFLTQFPAGTQPIPNTRCVTLPLGQIVCAQ